MGIAITDIIYKVKRRDDSGLDSKLEIVEFNTKIIKDILNSNNIDTIFFTSKYAGRLFKKQFKDRNVDSKLISLPSPSPRYASMSFDEKCEIYENILPKL